MDKLQKKVNKLGKEFGLKHVILEAIKISKHDKTLDATKQKELLKIEELTKNI